MHLETEQINIQFGGWKPLIILSRTRTSQVSLSKRLKKPSQELQTIQGHQEYHPG